MECWETIFWQWHFLGRATSIYSAYRWLAKYVNYCLLLFHIIYTSDILLRYYWKHFIFCSIPVEKYEEIRKQVLSLISIRFNVTRFYLFPEWLKHGLTLLLGHRKAIFLRYHGTCQYYYISNTSHVFVLTDCCEFHHRAIHTGAFSPSAEGCLRSAVSVSSDSWSRNIGLHNMFVQTNLKCVIYGP